MAYEKQNFSDGKVLTAKQLNHMEDGISKAEQSAGEPGPKGDPGFSPTVGIQPIDGGHKVTITDADGPHEFNVMNGKDGSGGGGMAGVSSFNDRTGDVMPQPGDYSAEDVGARPDTWMPNASEISFDGKETGLSADNVQDAIKEAAEMGGSGTPAGFGEITVSVDGSSGDPTATVETSGPNTAKNIAIYFTGLKGTPGIDGNPIGTIISYMGTTAPDGYLVCDGGTYPIGDYPELADFIEEQYGDKAHFGGDGVTDFAVPTLSESGGVLRCIKSYDGASSGGIPIGTITPFMGLDAPKGYLACDGSIYNITDYPNLADFFEQQFGDATYFGYSDEGTFAVPDMRNLFLRGYHGNSEDQSSEDVGVQQAPTWHIDWYMNPSAGVANPQATVEGGPINMDYRLNFSDKPKIVNLRGTYAEGGFNSEYYAARPVNMAVLFCIKAVGTFEPEEKKAVGQVTAKSISESKVSADSQFSFDQFADGIYASYADPLPREKWREDAQMVSDETLEKMTKSELLDYAAEAGVEGVSSAMKKAEIIEAIKNT